MSDQIVPAAETITATPSEPTPAPATLADAPTETEEERHQKYLLDVWAFKASRLEHKAELSATRIAQFNSELAGLKKRIDKHKNDDSRNLMRSVNASTIDFSATTLRMQIDSSIYRSTDQVEDFGDKLRRACSDLNRLLSQQITPNSRPSHHAELIADAQATIAFCVPALAKAAATLAAAEQLGTEVDECRASLKPAEPMTLRMDIG